MMKNDYRVCDTSFSTSGLSVINNVAQLICTSAWKGWSAENCSFKDKKQMTDRKQLNVPKKMSSLSCWFMFCIIFCLFYFHLDFFLRINESKIMLTYMNKFIFYFCMNFDSKNSLNYLIGQIFELFMNNSRTSILGISEQGNIW